MCAIPGCCLSDTLDISEKGAYFYTRCLLTSIIPVIGRLSFFADYGGFPSLCQFSLVQKDKKG